MPEAAEFPDPRYPIGKFALPPISTSDARRDALLAITELPERLRGAVGRLDAGQMNTPYREGGWTVLQVVHHISDSHATALHRLKRALTEEWPEVHGYDETAFATLPDVAGPAEPSLALIDGVHAHWVMLLQAMDEAQWKRGFRHTERGPMTLEVATQLYAWHSKHHVAHITRLRELKGW